MNRIDRASAFAILFLNGWEFALPVTDAVLPLWFTPIQVVHGVWLHEAVYVIYLATSFVVTSGRLTPQPRIAQRIAILIAGLGVLGILSGLVNEQPVREVVGPARYLLLAAYFLSALSWSRRYGSTFVLRGLLLGMAAAGTVNLYYAFSGVTPRLGALPFLVGQNGPGGFLGIAVILSAWLMLERAYARDAAIAVVSCAIGVFAASISYSKLAMLMAAAGAVAWVFVIFRDLTMRHSRRVVVVTLVLLCAFTFAKKGVVLTYTKGVNSFIDYKFRTINPETTGARFQYFLITGEILLKHPLLGVGYGGFYDAATATEAYKSARRNEEDPEGGARGESNPHSSFLYYASANGFPGLILTLVLLSVVSMVLSHALTGRGVAGKVVWSCLVFGYLIFGLTLPSLFNTSILYLPAAVGTCMSAQVRRRARPPFFLRRESPAKELIRDARG
jgi:hypothetical protein